MFKSVDYDVIVIGAGHAGIEAGFATSNLGIKTLIVTLNELNVANCPCNPSIGGPAKGIVTREIDALGGVQGQAADACQLQMKLLNFSKGPSVQALRAQIDKIAYNDFFLKKIKHQPNLSLLFAEFSRLIFDPQQKLIGIQLSDNSQIKCKVVIITTGTYLNSTTYCGFEKKKEGPDASKTTFDFSKQLLSIGFELLRLKTGTSPRIFRKSVDFSQMKLEPGTNAKLAFSHFYPRYLDFDKQLPCYLVHTNTKIHECIRNNIDQSYLLSTGKATIGPKYCPSIEDKVLKFDKKLFHQVFVEPESKSFDTIYLSGFSTSMAPKVQDEIIHYFPGFQNAVIKKYGYAIEYDAIQPLQLFPTLASKKIPNLFFAGQINGTSGYEEAAGQGIVAGINAAQLILNKEPLILRRSESYIGVMIDDIVTKGVTDPYRLLTSRAEYRLFLRNDNADDRLLQIGHKCGLISNDQMHLYHEQKKRCDQVIADLKHISIGKIKKIAAVNKKTNLSLYDYAKSLTEGLTVLAEYVPSIESLTDQELRKIEILIKYEGYIKKAINEIRKMGNLERINTSRIVDYSMINNLATEAIQKLNQIKPINLGQASRIPGINLNDLVMIKRFLERVK